MATYRFSAQLVKRSAGRSATAAAAYRAGIAIPDQRLGLLFDYTRRRDVLHSEIRAPEGTPLWMRDRAQLWNAVEAVEKRKDAQLARELQLSLPHELSAALRLELLRSFVEAEFVARGMIADLSVHAPDRGGDNRNHHAHVLLTLRELTGEGFGKKAREWNETTLLEHWREQWAIAINQALERHGHASRVDHRSLAAQGLDREPEPKVGPIATEIERQGRSSFAGDERRAVQARNQAREILQAKLAGIAAEIIDLEAERAKRQPDPPEATPVAATTDGGLVAQQREANRLMARKRLRFAGDPPEKAPERTPSTEPAATREGRFKEALDRTFAPPDTRDRTR